tara:strand:- start:484 stop:1026 length:543 start_codon:yes stop_codon:yes gene_type:complete
MYSRLAVIAGTTNETEIMNDPTGNRRIIPIEVDSRDRSAYDLINKTSLFMEIFRLYESGENTELTKEQIKFLNDNTKKYNEESNLAGLIDLNFKPGEEAFDGEVVLRKSSTQISETIKGRSQGPVHFTLKTLGMELAGLGFVRRKSNGKQYYNVVLHDEQNHIIGTRAEVKPYYENVKLG